MHVVWWQGWWNLRRCADIKKYTGVGLVQYDCYISINVHCSKYGINVESM
jgi:hypothetical protein